MSDIMDVLSNALYLVLLLGIGTLIILLIGAVSILRSKKTYGLVMVTKRDFIVQNPDTGGEETISAGTHQVERIPNPCTTNGISWIVIRGTTIGMPEDYWRRWEGAHWAHFQVEIRESSR